MRKAFFFHIVLLVWAPALLQAQGELLPVARHITVRNGLADHHVKYFFQDSRGLVWLNTNNGLQRFDGINFLTFNYEPMRPKGSLPSGIMNFGITEDDAGNIWAVTEHEGPVKFSVRTGEITSFNQGMLTGDHLRTHTIVRRNDGQLFATSINGLIRLHDGQASVVATDSILQRDKKRSNQRGMVTDEEGNLWIATERGFLLYDLHQRWHCRERNPTGRQLLNNSYSIAAFFKDEGHIWYSTWELDSAKEQRFLYRYNLRSNRTDSVCLPSPPVAGDSYFSIPVSMTQDPSGNTWIATQGNHLLVYDDSMRLLHDYGWLGTGGQPLKPESLGALFCDRDGYLWISSMAGVSIVHPAPLSTRHIVSTEGYGFSRQEGNTRLIAASDGHLYINSISRGLFRWASGTVQLEGIPQNILSGKWKNYQAFLTADSTRLYFNPWFTDAIIYYDLRQRVYKPLVPPGQIHLWGFKAFDVGDYLLAAGRYSVKLFNKKDGRLADSFSLAPGNPLIVAGCRDGYRRLLLIDTKGYLYEAGPGMPVKRTLSFSLPLKGGDYTIACTDSFVFVGTPYEGLKVFNRQGILQRSITTRDGLLSNSIRDLFSDNKGQVWIGSPGGYNYIADPRSMQVYAVPELDRRQHEFSTAACDGRTGFYILHKDHIAHMPQLSFDVPATRPFVFTNIQAGHESIPVTLSNNAATFDWSGNTVSFGFAALDYVMAGALQYRYRLNGKHAEWIFAGNSNRAILPALRPGRYLFEAQYRHPNGNWQPNVLTYAFTIRAPFWRQWWFMVLVTLLVVLPVAIIVRRDYRNRRKIEGIRWQVSRDLHDDVGSTLSSIGIYSSILENRIMTDKEKRIAGEIKEKAMGSIHNMADIVWAINPENDRLENLFHRFKAYAAPLLESRQIDLIWRDACSDADLRLNMLQRRNLYLLFKEALNNSLKHAQATVIDFHCYRQGHRLYVVLGDNGIGFDESTLLRKSGLQHMRQRIQEIKGSLSIRSLPGQGCTITLSVPVA